MWALQDTFKSLPTEKRLPLIECPNIQPQVIRNHYDISTLFYRLLWGPHIHHGYWEANESPRQAQLQLTQRLAGLAHIDRHSDVLDVGCGMGGSSQWLAQQLDCRVTGVTVSSFQKHWATWSARLQGCRGKVNFLCQDAERLELPASSLDIVWSIECTEHLYDKPQFFRSAAGWLRPGGRTAICAWLAGHDEAAPSTIEQVTRVCEGMFCPSLGSQPDYVQWLEEAGLRVVENQLWTQQVLRTWEICKSRIDRTGVRWLARLLGKDHILFLNRFDAILDAYRSGAMEYGCFVAVKD